MATNTPSPIKTNYQCKYECSYQVSQLVAHQVEPVATEGNSPLAKKGPIENLTFSK